MTQPVLRLIRFTAVTVGFDATVRGALARDIDRLPGIRGIICGRVGPGQEGERLLASLWTSEAAMHEAIASGVEPALSHPETLPGTPDHRVDVMPIEVSIDPGPTAGGIIRVVAGVALPGQLDAYVAEARDGTLRDRERGIGPVALYLAVARPDRFVTLSMWDDWAHVEAATGADHLRVDRTRHAERLASWTVEHFEVIPGLAVVRGDSGRDVDRASSG